MSVSSDSADESGINKMAQALGPGEIAGPPAFDISGDATSAGSRWKRWKKAFQYYLLARGVNNPNQQKALLLHVAGMDVQDVFETLTDPGHPDEVDPDPHNIYERALRTLDSHFIPTINAPFERHMFHKMKQEPQETVAQYVARMRVQAQLS